MIEIGCISHLVRHGNRNSVKSRIPSKNLQGMTINVGLTYSVRDTTLCFAISIEQGD